VKSSYRIALLAFVLTSGSAALVAGVVIDGPFAPITVRAVSIYFGALLGTAVSAMVLWKADSDTFEREMDDLFRSPEEIESKYTRRD